MPYLRGITAHVTDSHGEKIPEWGTQYLRQQSETKRVSTYVQSTTNVSFQVSLQPDIPFIRHFPPTDTSGGEKIFTRQNKRRLKTSSEDRPANKDHEQMSNNTLSSPVRHSAALQSHSGPDFAFLASLYLDGRRIPEHKIIVYTDPADRDFNSPDGKVTFKHRRVQSADGRITEHAWVFKEKAIETVFDKLMIAGSQGNVEDQDDDALIKAMESSGFDVQENTEKESKVGQIVVELRRVVLGKKRTASDYRARHQEGQDEDIDMEGVQRDITHATGFVHKNTLASQPLRVVDYWPYKPNEGHYATFQFFYRSQEQLQKFQFLGFPSFQTTTTARTTRFLNARMADLTPLSISLPLDQKTKKLQRDQDSYEAKVNKRGFKPDDSQKHDFGSEYRDIRATSPSAVDEAHKGKKPPKYSAAPLPFLANQQFENTKIDRFSLKTSPTTAEAPFLAGQFVASDLKCKLQPQEQAPQSFNSDTTTSITTEPSSSPPSSTDFTKEQTANITDKDRYRPTAGDSYSSDQEENADDEHATESDLETHAGDDNFSYAANPEEEDEGYDSLQSRFKNVRIRKRQRDDVEDAEDEHEAWQGADPAHFSGDGKQKTRKLPLTEEERAHRGKKPRTAPTTSAADGGQNAHGTRKTEEGGVAPKSVPCAEQERLEGVALQSRQC